MAVVPFSAQRLPLAFLLVCLAAVGCRPAVPPSFSAGEAVVNLTADIEDPEELELYTELQVEIGRELRRWCGTPEKIKLLGEEHDLEAEARLKLGYQVYDRYCTQCHGVNGDGNGPAAGSLNPKPRNYTKGVYKFTSTPYGSKPRHSDLVLTIKRGVTGTSMPSFDRFSKEELEAVTDYVLALTHRGELEQELANIAYDEGELLPEEDMQDVVDTILEPWREAADQLVMPATPMPPMTEATVRAGHEAFLGKACNRCHGKFGRGGSMGGVEVGLDAWGNKAAAADLSSGMFHGGDRPIDIYRRIYSGINGTPMPAFETVFRDDPDAIWHMVHFIKATGDRRRQGLAPLGESDLPPQSAASESEAAQPPADDAEPAEVEGEESEEPETSDPAAA